MEEFGKGASVRWLLAGFGKNAAMGHIFYQMVKCFEPRLSDQPPKIQASAIGCFSPRPCSPITMRNHMAPAPHQNRQPEDGMSKQSSDADVAFIQALAELLNANDLTELSVKREYGPDDRLDVKVSKQTQMVAAPAPVYAPAPVATAAPAATTAAAAAPEDPAQHPGAVTSPMVGTVYLAAEPGAQPFITVGATVAEGQTVLIIEAMKTMNHIPAPRAGTVKRILVADGNAVEYGAPLLIIE
jgi:acetyl-CoA carboxylase biotin carboxyl carrier protein